MTAQSARERDDPGVAVDDDRLPYWWYARVVRRLCPQGGRLLDYGCGTGNLLKRLSASFEAFGYDPAPFARNRARTNVPDAVILEDWQVLPPSGLDVIVSLRGMEHAPQPHTLKQLAAKLRSGGLLLYAVPNPGGLGRRLKGARWFAHGDSAKLKLPTHAEWVMFVRKVGLEVQHVCGDGLWDAPYVGILPLGVQRALFGAPGALQELWPFSRPFLPAAVGECLIITARKP